jgi:hypothetical protein
MFSNEIYYIIRVKNITQIQFDNLFLNFIFISFYVFFH